MRIVLASCLAIIAFLVTYRKLRSKEGHHDGPEPPVVPPRFPFIGHAIGMMRHKKDYYQRLRDRYRLPIITLALRGSRVYVVFSAQTIQSVQKQHKTLAFQPIQAKLSVKLCGASKEAYKILERDMNLENGEYGNIYVAMHRALSPGKILDKLDHVTISHVCEAIDSIPVEFGIIKDLKLAEWLRYHVTLATTDAVYGPHNPFQDRKVEDAFCRTIVAKAFENFFLSNFHEQASELVKDFQESEISYGFSLSDRSSFEVGHALAILGNTSGAVFWMIFYVFSNPEALAEIRQEASTVIQTSMGEEGKKQHRMDMTKLAAHCPILVSAFREAVRLHSIGISLRQVSKDTVLNDTYHLRKDAMVLMPTDAVHTDPDVWGPNVSSFNHRCFHPSNSHKISPAAFRSFGGGTTLCPGRHFATTQVMAWTIMPVMRFELVPIVDGIEQQNWVRPTTEQTNLANVMSQPDHDMIVRVISRVEYGKGNWTVAVTNSEEMFGVTVEDLDEKNKDKP